MLLLAALLALAACGAAAPELPPSGRRLVVAATVALLAPLLWPGLADTPTRSGLRVLAWSTVAAFAAAPALWLAGSAGQDLTPAIQCGAVLLALLWLLHGASVLLEAHWRNAGCGAEAAREMAGRGAALMLALLSAMPLWLGPAGELLSLDRGWLIDALLSASPLTHLAVASGNDLLHNPWLYQHSNLAALPLSYPGLGPLAIFYTASCVALAVAALFWRHRAAAVSTKERTP